MNNNKKYTRIKASDLFVRALENENVEYVFGIPGEENLDIMDALLDSSIRFVTTRHEQGAAFMADGREILVHGLWNRRHSTKFNGVSYPVQRATEAVYSPEGQSQVRELIDYYMKNAAYIRKAFRALGFDCVGGKNSPYVWINSRRDSWAFFDLLLSKAGVVCTPGVGFGKCGQGYIRLSAFNSFENVQEAMTRIKNALSS